MRRVPVDGVEPDHLGGGVVRRGLSEPLGAAGVAVNRYRVPPGEGLPGGLHAHADQEEVFVVLAGEATFETLAATAGAEEPSPDHDGTTGGERAARAVTVRAGEAVRFAPGEFQTGRNAADGELVVLALGAPRDTEDVRVPATCPECGRGDVRLDVGENGVEFACPDCGATRVPSPCPECGSDDLRVVPGGEARTLVVCRDCGAEFDEPPLAG